MIGLRERILIVAPVGAMGGVFDMPDDFAEHPIFGDSAKFAAVHAFWIVPDNENLSSGIQPLDFFNQDAISRLSKNDQVARANGAQPARDTGNEDKIPFVNLGHQTVARDLNEPKNHRSG